MKQQQFLLCVLNVLWFLDGKTELLKMGVSLCNRPLLMGDSGATTDLVAQVPGIEAVLKPTVEGFDLL